MIPSLLGTWLYRKAQADRWRVGEAAFVRALGASAAKADANLAADAAGLERYLRSLHLEDLALACACSAGDEEAWQHFVLTYRPVLYRAANTISPGGGGRDLADSLYADLFGLGGHAGDERRSLFRYFHGRSSLATWLRAVLAQRQVDRVRADRKTAPIPDDDSRGAMPSPAPAPDPERDRFVVLMRRALPLAIAGLAPAERFRIACYYSEQMTLAQTGRLLGEHEATVSPISRAAARRSGPPSSGICASSIN